MKQLWSSRNGCYFGITNQKKVVWQCYRSASQFIEGATRFGRFCEDALCYLLTSQYGAIWSPGCCIQYRNLTLVKCFIDHSGIKCCPWWNTNVDKTEFDSRHYIFGKWARRVGWFTLTSITPTVPKLHVLITIYSSKDVIMPPNTFMISLIFNSISLTSIWYLFKLQPTNYPLTFQLEVLFHCWNLHH
jgi:hypothetical protein